MATDTSGAMDPNLQVDEFYKELRAKAQAHPEATVISGFIIESGDQLVRISTGVNSHVDVQPADIVASQKLPAGGTVHFINPKAQVTYGTTAAVTPANFLTGALTSAYLGGATGAPAADNSNGAPQALPPTHLMGCTTVTAAPTHLLGCTTATAAPTYMLGCTTATAAPTYMPGCTTVTAAPTHLLGCTTATAAPTHLLGCTTATAAPTYLMGCTTVTAAPEHQMGYAGTYTAATQCTHTQHPTCPGAGTYTAATQCTHTQHPTCPGAAQQQNGCVAYTIHPTIWTQITCPGSMPQNGCVGNGLHPTLWTQLGCGTHTAATVCTQLGCPGGAQQPAQAFVLTYGPRCHGPAQTLPPASVPPMCPGPHFTFGFTCTYVGCPGGAGHGGD